MNPKATAAIAVATAVLALISGNWETISAIYHKIMSRPQAEACIISSIIGCSIASVIPMLYPKMVKRNVTREVEHDGIKAWVTKPEMVDSSGVAKSMMRFASIAITFAICWRMVPTEMGAFYALLAAFAGTQMMMLIWRLISLVLPQQLTPAAFQETPK